MLFYATPGAMHVYVVAHVVLRASPENTLMGSLDPTP